MNRRNNLFACFLIFFSICSSTAQLLPDSTTLTLKAPDSFQALFTTTKGEIIIEAIRDWSPHGVDRLYQLLTTHFYDSNCFFRVQKDYVVQFGITDNPEVNSFWENHPIPDEPVIHSNSTGVISYARDGPVTRTVQLFINLKDNLKLDTIGYNGLHGFPPVARIVAGGDVLEKLYHEYGFEPANHQDSVMVYGNSYLEKHFPGLDYILEARLIGQ